MARLLRLPPTWKPRPITGAATQGNATTNNLSKGTHMGTRTLLTLGLLMTAASLFGLLAFTTGCGPQAGKSNGGNQVAQGNGAPEGGGAASGALCTPAEMEKAKEVYFDRCAGCHGVLRQGATGKKLTPDVTSKLGTAYLENIIYNGTAGGMPDWGKQGVLTKAEANMMARYIQVEPPKPPEPTIADIRNSWKVHVPVAKRPTAPPAGRNWENYMGVILRDVGKVAIIDGDKKELVSIVDSGFAVHILRTSATGRYFYTIGRDGKVTIIDLWMEKPQTVAECKIGSDARSVDSSKFKGFEDKYLIVGGYWPPAMVILDGLTLEPLKMHRTSDYTHDIMPDGKISVEYKEEARVASIVSSHHDPIWVVNVKEAGMIWLVDYSNIDALRITKIEADTALHDGGWDGSKRYFLVAANAKNKVAIVDTVEKKLVGLPLTEGVKPHPGRGANLVHDKFGPLWATGHIGSNHISFIGTDPDGHSQYAWKIAKVTQLPGDGGGNLFIKTHPNSNNIWCDRPLHNDPKLATSLFVLDKKTLEVKQTIEIPEKWRNGTRVVHPEYNKNGDEVWVAVWGKKDQPTAILVYDDKTLKLKAEITGDWMLTPTGKFNVYNTAKDIY